LPEVCVALRLQHDDAAAAIDAFTSVIIPLYSACLGFASGEVDLATHIDLSIVKEAAARIK
jgi:hypothetical protein